MNLDALFLAVDAWMKADSSLAFVGAFLWGLVSVLFSPCHLASIPLIVGYVGGQNRLIQGREGALYSGMFSLGLFVSIALVGLVCSALGMLLGEVGAWAYILVGVLLVAVGLSMAGVVKCSLPMGNFGARFGMRGLGGALCLGLGYGLLSGACTFGFIAPILAMITLGGAPAKGIALIVLFALGHCLPILVAGASTALVQRWLSFTRFTGWGRKAACVVVCLVGVFFIAKPFMG